MKKTLSLIMAAMLLVALTPGTAWAKEFITDVKLIGADTRSALQSYLNSYRAEGWKVVDYDLNKGAGGDYIYLIYRTDFNNNNPYIRYITQFYISVGTNYPDHITLGLTTYYLVSYDGTSHFRNVKGDLNSNSLLITMLSRASTSIPMVLAPTT